MSGATPAIAIPNYEILEELAGNDWYALYRARRVADRRPVLIKTPRRHTESAVNLLDREFETLRSFSITGVPQAIDLLRCDGQPYLVLEDLGCEQLQKLLACESRTLDLFFRIAIQLAGILSRLHGLGITHHNINPRSIFVTSSTGEAHLFDFSLAAGAGASHSLLPQHLGGEALAYVSPEQVQGATVGADHRTDLYSLGVCFYEILGGVRPFRSEQPLELINDHITKAPPALSDLDFTIPGAVADIVMRLLEKNPKDRYQSAIQVKEDLEACAKEWAAHGRVDGERADSTADMADDSSEEGARGQAGTLGRFTSSGNDHLGNETGRQATRQHRAEETLRSIVEGTAAVTGGDFFAALVRHLAFAIGSRYAFLTECTDATKTRVRTLAFWAGDSFAENIEYDLALTPCERVIAGNVCHYPSGLQNLFPGDADLAELEIESFVGIPVCDASGEVLGHLAVLDSRPMPDASWALPLLKIFAARAGAELERLRTEQELRRALAEVEQLRNQLHAENIYLQEEIRREHNFKEIVGNSPALLELLSSAERVAATDSTVMISGETGTGKELIARAIHDRSRRSDHPLVKVNCGAISAGLVESELFGHVKGAFTGAIDRRVGRFELANGGTLFLDEVSELPFDTQVKLLRVLQEGEFEPVGSSRTVRVEVRIIGATNRDLDEAVRQGRFRSDLYYRLNVFPLRAPALRERKSDIPQLAMFFLTRYSKKLGRHIGSISQDTMDRLINYSWPGNVRELQNIIERAAVLSTGSTLVLDRDLVPVQAAAAPGYPAAEGNTSAPPASEGLTLDEVERRHVLSVLEQVGWVIEGSRGAARILDIHPNTLRSRMKKLGIARGAREIS